jgi:hypothetical protein
MLGPGVFAARRVAVVQCLMIQGSSPDWPTGPPTGRGRSHGTSSKEPFDRWFRYPAGFASDYVRTLLDHLGHADGTLVDCFAGSGVTLTAARQRGLASHGIEAHPVVAELAQLKIEPKSSADEVRNAAKLVADEVRSAPNSTPVLGETDLVRRSFSDEVLSDLVGLRTSIKEIGDDGAAAYLKWSLLATLRDVAHVKVGWPYQRPGVPRKPRFADPIVRFETRAQAIADDLETISARAPSGKVIIGDSSQASTWDGLNGSAQACISSPPYLNNFDYADATRLELYFWGAASTWREMCTNVRADMLTASTQQSSINEAAEALEGLSRDFRMTHRSVSRLISDIVTQKRLRGNRSKEYDRVIPAYFQSMAGVLTNLHGHLDAGADVVWLVGDSAPYGVHIDTPKLIADLAEEIGFKPIADVVLRHRGNRWRSNPDRHTVPLTERLIAFQRGGT